MLKRGRLLIGGIVLLCATLLAVPLAFAEERASFSGDRLAVRNLVGEVRVESGTGDFEVVVTPGGRDASPGRIVLDRGKDELTVVFPGDVDRFVYPRMRKGSTTLDIEGWLEDVVGRRSGQIRIGGDGKGQELWADVTVYVPRGASLEVRHGVGKVLIDNVSGQLELATSSGDVEARGVDGSLEVATGSGDVELDGISGPRLHVATGSGDVQGRELDGDEVKLATGSGDVTLDGLRGDDFEVGTGSGDVVVDGVAMERLSIGTGSGSVELAFDRLDRGECNVGTGSGDIRVRGAGRASVRLHAETHGGKVDVDLPGADYTVQRDDEVRLTLGGGGASVTLGTGNGDIRVRP